MIALELMVMFFWKIRVKVFYKLLKDDKLQFEIL